MCLEVAQGATRWKWHIRSCALDFAHSRDVEPTAVEGPVLTGTNGDGYRRGTAAALAGIPVSGGHAAKGKAKPCLGGWLQDPGTGVGFTVPAPAEVSEVLKKTRGDSLALRRGPPCPLSSESGRQESKLSKVDGEKLVLHLQLGWFYSNLSG